MNQNGKTIRLFLVDGSPLGIITAEIINWTGRVLTFPRGLLPEARKRGELGKTGVYFLVGADPQSLDGQLVYIGKSDDIASRLMQHDSDGDKDFFEKVAIFTSKDENLTIGHAGYLEFRLIKTVREVGLARLHNGNSSSEVSLPEAELCDMEFILQQLRTLLPALGFLFLQELPKPVTANKSPADTDSTFFELSYLNGSIKAEAYETEGRMVVLPGSTIRHPDQAAPSVNIGYTAQVRELLAKGKLKKDRTSRNVLNVVEDINFSTPSAASDLVCGASTNGRLLWKVKGTNVSYGEWRARKMDF